MNGNRELEIYSNTIEGALCAYDLANGNNLGDNDAIRIIEALIDLHHFGDQQEAADSQLIAKGVVFLEKAIKKDLSQVSGETIVKLLGVIWFVAKRRTKTGREYMNLIHYYVGSRIDTGIRILRLPPARNWE